MPDSESKPQGRDVVLPEFSALIVSVRTATLVSTEGEVETMTRAEAARRAEAHPLLFCYAPVVARQLGLRAISGFDILELFAFARPAEFAVPTPIGVAMACGLTVAPLPRPNAEAQGLLLMRAASQLLSEIADLGPQRKQAAGVLAASMARAGWAWGPAVAASLGDIETKSGPLAGLEVWRRLPDWEEEAPPPPPEDVRVMPDEARERLRRLTRNRAEDRPAQIAYAEAAADAFRPRDLAGVPAAVLAEAGTGVGKTLGYIAPASVWAEKSGGAVWISTYTKNLQRQIDGELDTLYSDAQEKARKSVIRKGRENYVCLLNYENAVARAGLQPERLIGLSLIALWAAASRDGDMVGGDYPAWLGGRNAGVPTGELTDRRGECIYSACMHYRKCFIEKSVRKARRAEIVVANHALVMIQAALNGEGGALPTRYVFDEGHHLFDAADGAFSAHLSAVEATELRRWIRGPETVRRGGSRMRGLEKRIGDLIGGEDVLETALRDAVSAASALPGEGWRTRLAQSAPQGPAEAFLAAARIHVYARSDRAEDGYSLEASASELPVELVTAGARLRAALGDIVRPLKLLSSALAAKLDRDAEKLTTPERTRIEAVCRGLKRRVDHGLSAWIAMLEGLGAPPPDGKIDWFSIDRIDGREFDVGLHRHWIDPTKPFAEVVLEQAHGALITSATLRDHGPNAGDGGDPDYDWRSAEMRTGAAHLVQPPKRIGLPSPFDYVNRTRIVVVNDLRRTEIDQIAAAYRELFSAAGGGALGLFTAISRLRQVHQRIALPLEDRGIALLAQHVDPMDTGTLVDIFRAEPDSCLLGTDAVRDGVDVPGHALRLIVFDRVPWPRPTILHRARREAFGRKGYDDMLTRLRLKQAFGRLIRSRDDYGVFVILDAMTPSRLLDAFPAGVPVERAGLADAIARTREFIGRWRN